MIQATETGPQPADEPAGRPLEGPVAESQEDTLDELTPIDGEAPAPAEAQADAEAPADVEAPDIEALADEAPANTLEHVPAPLRGAIERRGFDQLTAVQSAVLESADPNTPARDLQISSQTGSGKTVALGFVLARPFLERGSSDEPFEPAGPRAIVIVPTRELAAQVSEELAWLFRDLQGVRVDCVTGGTSTFHDRDRLRSKPAVLVATPGRLLDHIQSGALDASDVRELVLDEADQMLDMGFREELENILEATPTDRRTHLVSATFPEGIRRLAQRYQQDPLSIEGTKLGAANEDIVHVAHLVHDRDRYAALVNLLLLCGNERTLVFVKTRSETSELAEKLSDDGFKAAPLSGELHQSQRTATLRSFRAGTISILIATDVAARGLDIPEVATVIHGALAFDAEAYTHRSGRTGRAGNQGHSVSLVSVKKERQARRVFDHARVDVDWRPVPGRKAILKVLKKRERRRLWEAMATAPEPPEDQLELARRLLETGDPEHVVATLLSELGTNLRIEPFELNAPKPRADYDAKRNRNRDRYDNRNRDRYDNRSRDRYDDGPRGRYDDRNGNREYGHPSNRNGRYDDDSRHGRDDRGRRPHRSRDERGAFVRFSINWGFEGGATPKRILAHVCRRGNVRGHEVGAIRLDPRTSFFDIDARMAEEFADRVRLPDSRDPKLRIYRVPDRNERY